MLAMDANIEPQSKVGVRDLMRTKTDHKERSKRYSGADTLRRHVQGHNKEKSFFLISLEAHQTYSVNLKTIGGQDYRDLDAQ